MFSLLFMDKMFIHEVELDETALAKLIRFSEDWTAENSCYGYRPNDICHVDLHAVCTFK